MEPRSSADTTKKIVRQLGFQSFVMSIKPPGSVLSLLTVLALAVVPARAELISVSASGKINPNSTASTTIPAGTPWSFEIIYNTDAPDRDFELTGTPDPTFGIYNNNGAIPALTFFHYRAGTYEVTIDGPNDFGPFSAIHISFGGTNAIDINLFDPGLFPPLDGRAVTFHADFGDFTHSIFTSDALPTNIAIGLASFQDASVTLLPSGGAIFGSLSDITSFKIAAVPEPSTSALAIIGITGLLLYRSERSGRWRRARLPRAHGIKFGPEK